jgi:CubicO group peptidase (beta-lactamase class C family)
MAKKTGGALHKDTTMMTDGDADRTVDALMAAYRGLAPGASALVLHRGSALLRRAYGYADLEQRVPATSATNYRLASVTKQFTAAAILLLAEDGRIRLDDGIRTWLPSLPAAADRITLHHLLTHTSGVIDYEDAIPATTRTPLKDADVLRLLEAEPRTYFAPGASYRYSNSGYALLALAAAAASGTSFAALLRARIFEPLGMLQTVAYEEGATTVANRAYGYTERDGAWVRTDQSLTSAVLGDGGIYSSVDDLAKWDAALYDERLLSRDSLRQAFTAATATDEPDVQYGFGWRITGESLWHSGETIGFRNVVVRFPKRRLSVFVLTNRDEPRPYALALAIAEVFRQSDAPVGLPHR